MSEYKVCFSKIKEINPHPDPETTALEIATIYGFQVVIRKGSYSVGDFALYVPVDSLIPADLESIVFGENAKIKLTNGRVKQIRIRKFPSQGMLIDVTDVRKLLERRGLKVNMDFKLEHCYAEMLGIKKYEPPAPDYQQPSQRTGIRKQNCNNPLFHSYNGIDNIKWYPDAFVEGEEVVIEEKLHGTNARASYLPRKPKNLLERVLDFFNLLPKYEYCYGSNNVELTNRKGYVGFYGEDVYGKTFNKLKVFDKLKENEIIYGEIIGEGIQKNYHYGHKDHHFILFDVKIVDPATGDYVWLNPEEVESYAKERGFDFVPVLYRGPYNKQLAEELVTGDSVYCPSQKIREGIVIKSRHNINNVLFSSKKKMLKWISPAYLDKNNTDFH